MILPRLRDDVQLSAHAEGEEQYLVLHDPFGIADGPIMLHADMFEVLAACDGQTTLADLAIAAGVDPQGPEIRRVELFLRQIQQLGYLEGADADQRRRQVEQAWLSLPTRPMACADATYPSDPEEFARFCRDKLGILQQKGPAPSGSDDGTRPPAVALIPHIDFRVAPKVYGEAFNAIASSPASLVVMVGTSHYWSDHPVVVAHRPFDTPLGPLPVIDHALGMPEADIAHKPEHSLELHAVALRYLWPDRDLAILPVLVTSAIFEQGALETWSSRVRSAVEASGREAIWLISGDLAHIGPKFGDALNAGELLPEVRSADERLISALMQADVEQYHQEIHALDNTYRICGHAPTVLALSCSKPGRGLLLQYDVWDDAETESAVTFASIVWQ